MIAPTALPSEDQTTLVRATLFRAVERNFAPAILLSGGLDTSIVAEAAATLGLREAVTVLASEDAPDAPFARSVALRLGLRHHIVVAGLEGILSEAPFVCSVLKTFDPMEIRNSAVIACGLREAARLGIREIMTGDGADELFAGYSFMWSKSEAEFETAGRKMASVMRFSSVPIGETLGVKVRAPFLDPEVVGLANSLKRREKVGEHQGRTHGKLALRLAFPDLAATWRRKDPIEVGSGASRATEFFAGRITADEFAAEQSRILEERGVEIRDPEHLAYFEAFDSMFHGRPPRLRDGSDPCPKCRYQMIARDADFCVTCGAWPVKPRGPGTARASADSF